MGDKFTHLSNICSKNSWSSLEKSEGTSKPMAESHDAGATKCAVFSSSKASGEAMYMAPPKYTIAMIMIDMQKRVSELTIENCIQALSRFSSLCVIMYVVAAAKAAAKTEV